MSDTSDMAKSGAAVKKSTQRIATDGVKKTTQRIKAVTQKIAMAEEKLEEAISHEIDSVESGARKVDKAVSSFGKNHPIAYGILITFGVIIALIVVGFLCAEYYSNR